MTDEALRELERKFHETGSVADERRVLLERVRAGQLDAGRLEVAALFGHKAAGLVRQEIGPRRMAADEIRGSTRGHLQGWVHEGCPHSKEGERLFFDFPEVFSWRARPPFPQNVWQHPLCVLVDFLLLLAGRKAALRAGVAVARYGLETWEKANPRDTAVRQGLEAAERWISCPCSECAELLSDASVAAEAAPERKDGWNSGVNMAKTTICSAVENVARATEEDEYPWDSLATQDTVRNAQAVARALVGGNEVGEFEVLRDAVAREIVPWALGHSDPVVARVKTAPLPKQVPAHKKPVTPPPARSATTLAQEDRGRLAAAVRKHKLERKLEALEVAAVPCLALTTRRGRQAPLGASRFGGAPDLPGGVEWPQEDGRFYSFLAQVNLAELPATPPLPHKGHLYFFVGRDDSADDVGHRILYSADATMLERRTLPSSDNLLNDAYDDLSPTVVQGSAAISLPSYGSGAFDQFGLSEDAENDEASRYVELAQELLRGDSEREVSVLLGHPTCLGKDPAEDAAILRGLGHPRLSDRAWERKNKPEIQAEARSWVLLFQLESHRSVGVNFWDAGSLRFFVRRDALAALDFSRTYAAIATS